MNRRDFVYTLAAAAVTRSSSQARTISAAGNSAVPGSLQSPVGAYKPELLVLNLT